MPMTQSQVSSTRDAALSGMAIQRLLANAAIWFKNIETDPLPEGLGTLTIRFRKWNSMSVAGVPVPTSEGVTVSPSTITPSYLEAVIEQYSDVVDYTDLAERAYEKGKLAEEVVTLITEKAGEERARILVNLHASGTNRYFAGNVADTINVVTGPVFTDMLRLDRRLREANVLREIRAVDPSTGIGTLPVAQSYLGITPQAASYNWENMPEFTKVEAYGNPGDTIDNDEIGAVNKIRLVGSTLAPVQLGAGAAVGGSGLRATGGNVDVYSTFIRGAGALRMTSYGNVPLDVLEKVVKSNGTMHLKREVRGLRITTLKDADKSDVNNQRRLSGYIYEIARAIVQPLAMVEFQHGVTA